MSVEPRNSDIAALARENAKLRAELARAKAQQRQSTHAEELHDLQRRLERASLSSQEGHWELDVRTGRAWVSASYCALLGYAPGEVDLSTREKYLALVHPEDRARETASTIDRPDQSAPFEMEIRMRQAHGEWRWMRLRGMVEFDTAGQALRTSGSIQDIHLRKLAEDNLQRLGQRLERAIRGTQDGLWEWDIEQDTFWVSPRYEAILGYDEREMPQGVEFRQSITHPDDLPHVLAAHAAHFDRRVALDVETRVRHRSGNYIWIRARGEAERDASGKPVRVSGSIQDVTEARAARDALIAATQAAHAANQAKGEFLANVSHEIRTPMNGIIGMVTLLLDTQLHRMQRDYAQTIRASADSLLTVVNDILDFSKIEAGKLDIESLDLGLPAHIEDVAAMMAFQAAAKNLELIVNVQPDVPQHVKGDAQRIRQCLINLIGNAIKFTLHGEVVVEVGVLEREPGKALIRFEVSDTGIGISPEVAKNLYQPFVQADSSTTRSFGGTGLGLSIVRRLAEMMGGQVGVDSVPGEGSTFWFTLPFAIVASADTQPAANCVTTRYRVLVVDDNETARRVLAAQLAAAGQEVELAASGKEAQRLLQQSISRQASFDIVLVDHQMPEMDGPALCKWIKSDPQLATTKVVLLTSLGQKGGEELLAQGFAGYLIKPVRRSELLDCLERVLAPAASAQNSSQTARMRSDEEPPAKLYHGQVLVVEDNAINQMVAQRFLERLGCEVRIAANGTEAVQACAQAHFDLVLMDLQMPIMDGYVATREIRAAGVGRARVPIFALTANAIVGQLDRCLAADMDGLLTKPLSVDRLREVLDRAGLKRASE